MTATSPAPRRKLGLGTRILVGMALGATLGAVLGERAGAVEPVGDLFIRLLMLSAVPLVFVNLLAGLTALTDVRAFGRLSVKILAYYLVTTVVAVALGLVAIATLRPGVGMALDAGTPRDPGTVPSFADLLLDLVPTNVFQAFSEGNVAQLIVVASLLGATTLLLPQGPRDRLRTLYADLSELFRALVDVILRIAPYGIGALMAVTVGRYGGLLFGPMARFVGGVWGAQLVMVGVYVALLRAAGWGGLTFLRKTGTVWATTAATTSSLASLSVALEVAEELRLPRPVYAFTLPLGAQVNKDGTAILLVGVALFTAQAAGVALSPAELFTAALMALVLSAGSGGIPGGGFVVSLILVRALDLPLGVAAIVGGIYRLVDMGNTTLNVMGDMVGTILVAHSEERRTGEVG